MTTRNICLIGFIIGCMLLVWYMTFYGSVLMKHLTEGFETETGYPVNLYVVRRADDPTIDELNTQKVVYDLESTGFHVRSQRFVVDTNVNINVNQKLLEIDESEKATVDTYESLLVLTNSTLQEALSEDVYHLFVWPSFIGSNIATSFIQNKNGENVSRRIHVGQQFRSGGNLIDGHFSTFLTEYIKTHLIELPLNPEQTGNEQDDDVPVPDDDAPVTDDDSPVSDDDTPVRDDDAPPTTPGFSLPTDPISVSHTVHVTGIPSQIKHNVNVVNKTPVSDIADDYGLTSLSRNPSYFPSLLPTPEITTTNPNGKMNIASSFLGALLSGITVQS